MFIMQELGDIMIGTVDFNMILELNRFLKKEGYDYSVHSIGGCASCGLSLKNEGKESDLEDVMKVINDFLKKKWLKAVPSLEDPYTLGIISTFYKEESDVSVKLSKS